MSEVTREEIAQIVSQITKVSLSDVLQAQSLKDLNIQSLDKIELICAIEDRYHIDMALADESYLLTLDQAVDYIKSKIQLKSQKPNPV